jgi:hypothetical protein
MSLHGGNETTDGCANVTSITVSHFQFTAVLLQSYENQLKSIGKYVQNVQNLKCFLTGYMASLIRFAIRFDNSFFFILIVV